MISFDLRLKEGFCESNWKISNYTRIFRPMNSLPVMKSRNVIASLAYRNNTKA